MANGRALKKKNKRGAGDRWIIVLSIALSMFGIIMVFSASYYKALNTNGNPYAFLIDDVIYTGLALVIMFFAAKCIDYRYMKLAAWPAIVIGFILLALIWSPLGVTINRATRWLNFKVITLMPGEIIKTCLILFYAKFLADDPDRINHLKPMAVLLLFGGAAAALVALQPNASTAGTIALICAAMIFAAGLKWKWIGVLALVGCGGFAALIAAKPYMLTRITTFFDPFQDALGDGYQVVQGLMALGSGGVFGVGLGKSVQKTLYLPEPQNDFIMCIIGEELGFVGILVLIAVYMLLIWRCIKVCINISDYYGMMLATGITAHLALQVILNIAVISASFPPTGISLPFISQGGNSILLFLFEMGLMYNISRSADYPESAQNGDNDGE